MKFTDRELEVTKSILADRLGEWVDPSVSQLLAKDIAYLKLDLFDPDYAEIVLPTQTALRKIIEEIILRKVNETG